jgi:hypothetical protein
VRKYDVHRVDHSPRHPDCQYLVLDLTHDEAARAAALAYGSLRLTLPGIGPETTEEDREWLLLLIEQVRALPPLWPGGEGGPTARSAHSSHA